MVDNKKLNILLLQNIDRICREFFPNGKERGDEWIVGDINGSKGSSLLINRKKGVWKDFADNSKDGDLVSLFHRLYGDNHKEAYDKIYNFLGLKQFGESKEVKKVALAFRKPKQDWEELDGEVYDYLVSTRKIPYEILETYEVKMAQRADIGLCYVFLYRHHKVNGLCLAFYVSLERDENGKKTERRSPDGLDALFGPKNWVGGNKIDSSEIVITGGQIDAMSYAAQGIKAYSVPSGENNLKWIEINWDFLQQFRTIYISMDMDEAGKKAAIDIAGRLGMYRCRIVNLPYKDANECHQKDIDLYKALVCSEEIKPGVLQSARDIEESVWDFLSRGERRHQGIPIYGWIEKDSIKFNLRPREFTVWTGMEGSGKSNALYQMAAWLAAVHKKKVAIASLEEGPEVALSIMTQQAAAFNLSPENGARREDFDLVYRKLIAPYVYVYNHVGEAPVDDVFQFSEFCVQKYGCEHIIIDSLARINIDDEDTEEVKSFINRIVESMNTTGAHYHLVCHSRKKNEDEFSLNSMPKKRDTKGTVSIVILAFNVVAVWKNELKFSILSKGKGTEKYTLNEVAEWPDGYIAVRKQKATGDTGEYPIWYDKETFRIRRSYQAEDAPYTPLD